MATINLCHATFKADKHGDKRSAIAVLACPGMSDVSCFIEFDAKGIATVYTGEIWDYQLHIHSVISVQSGAATFSL